MSSACRATRTVSSTGCQASASIGRALSGREGIDATQLGLVLGFYALIALSFVARRARLRERIDASPGLSLVVYGALATAAIVLARDEAPQFIYFQF